MEDLEWKTWNGRPGMEDLDFGHLGKGIKDVALAIAGDLGLSGGRYNRKGIALDGSCTSDPSERN